MMTQGTNFSKLSSDSTTKLSLEADIESGRPRIGSEPPLPVSSSSGNPPPSFFCCAPPLSKNAIPESGSNSCEEDQKEFIAVYPADLLLDPTKPVTTDEVSQLRADQKALQRRRRRACCCRVACWSLIVLVFAITALGIAALVAYLTVSKQQPQLDVKRIDIVHVDITKSGGGFLGLEHFRLGLSAGVNLTARVYNPNNWDVEAENVTIDVKFFDIDVTNVTLPATVGMTKGGSTELTVPVEITDAPLVTLDPASLLTTPLLHGRAEMRVVVATVARVKYWGIMSPRVAVHVECTMKVEPFSAKKFDQQCTPSIAM